MAEYFASMKKISYSFEQGGANTQIVKDIFSRSNLLKNILTETQAFYSYTVREGETPEIVAHKYYGDAKKHWLVMFSNYIVNPYFEFPLDEFSFRKYIIKKYGGIGAAQSTIHHVEDVRFVTNIVNNTSQTRFMATEASEYYYDFESKTIQQRTLPGLANGSFDYASSSTTAPDGSQCIFDRRLIAVSCYDYEYYQNEIKREIKLLDNAYAKNVELELDRIMRE